MNGVPSWRRGLEKLPNFGPEFSIVPSRTALVLIDMHYGRVDTGEVLAELASGLGQRADRRA